MKINPTAAELNLDCESKDALMTFWFRYQGGRRYRELFPQGGRGTKNAASLLACYASNKATAQSLRMEGHIGTALMYEAICDRIYSDLPDWAKGW